MNQTAEYILDDKTRAWIAECNAQIQNLTVQMHGALNLFCRQNGLEGQWKLAPDGTRLLRTDAVESDSTNKPTNGTRKK